MSNPLAIFRKYEKILLAVFGVALMIVFTVGGIVSQYMGQSGQQMTNPVAVKLDTGDLRESDLQNLRAARYHLRNFMQMINRAAAEKGATPQRTLEIPNNIDESNLVQTAILASRAEELGIVISDDAILRFLERYTQGTMSGGEFAGILETITQGRMRQNQFFSAMRRELLALRYLNLFQRGMLPPTPAAAWDYFKRLNRKVTFQAVPFSSDDYLNKVDEPLDSEIVALYEKGKNQYPVPSSPEPGFKRMKKVAVQYAKADLSLFMEQAKAEITEQQIAEYYEENKEEFRNIELPDFDTEMSDEETDAMLDGLLESESQESSAKGPSAVPTDSTPDNQTPTDSAPTDATPEPTDQSQNRAATATRTLPVGQAEAADTTSASEQPASEAADGEDQPAQASADEQQAADSAETGQQPAEDPLAILPADGSSDASPDESIASEGDESPLGDLPEAPGAAQADPAEPEYKPLEEVSEEIHQRLARPIAREAMDKAINNVRGHVKSYFNDLRAWQLSTDRETTPRPDPPDFRSIVAEQGLTFGTVPLVNVYELMKDDPVTNEPLYEISRAYRTTPTYVPFYQRVYEDDLRLYDVQEIRGQVVDTEFLYWKTDEQPERVPELDEVREEVVKALKREQALELARQDAQQAAQEMADNNQRPSDKYRNDANREVITAESVSWMSSGFSPGMPPRLSTIDDIPYAGDRFMKTVFSLQPNETGVAINEPQTIAYAVAVISEDTDEDQLKTAFLRTFSQNPANATLLIAQRENRAYLQDWYQSLEEQLGVQWERDPTSEQRR